MGNKAPGKGYFGPEEDRRNDYKYCEGCGGPVVDGDVYSDAIGALMVGLPSVRIKLNQARVLLLMAWDKLHLIPDVVGHTKDRQIISRIEEWLEETRDRYGREHNV